VVDPIVKVGQNDEFCCWSSDDQSQLSSVTSAEAVTTRIALVSYLDALNLDGSDSTVWFKIAATARRLDRLQSKYGAGPKYRRLEQHALESAQACWLTRNRPPNQLISRAWREWQQSNDPDQAISNNFNVTPEPPDEQVLRLSLNRYSWAVVGRTLLRACREGTSYRQNPNYNSTNHARLLGVNPIVQLHLSPLLSIPMKVLGNVICWLNNNEVSSLKGTCRGLSVAILAARVKADSKVVEIERGEEKHGADDKQPSPMHEEPEQPKSLVSSKEEKSMQASRTSKRLQSQILNSGRRAERRSRRISVEYCLVGACLGGDPEYSQKISDEKLAEALNLPEAAKEHRPRSLAYMAPNDESRREALERVGAGSLLSFIKDLTGEAPTPLQATFHFLAHTSKHIDAVYSCESHGALVLSTCLVDALALLVRRTNVDNSTPCWMISKTQLSGFSDQDIFAVDLLHAEMRFKRCQRDEAVDTSFEGDIGFVASALPSLLSFVESKGASTSLSETFAKLHVRAYWLASTFFLWYSRATHGAPAVREAEGECLSFVEKITKAMEDTGLEEVRTPHLEGTGRAGSYWEKLSPASLSAFRTEIQATSVVLVSQEQFVDAISRVENSADLDSVSECVKILDSIGDTLLQRYQSPAGLPNENSSELIDDFLASHGSTLGTFPLKQAEDMVAWCGHLVPSAPLSAQKMKSLRNPCILSILAICLSFRPEGRKALADVLLNLILTIRDRGVELGMSRDDRGADPDDAASSMSDDSSLASEDDQVHQGTHEGVSSKRKVQARLLGLLAKSLQMVLDREWLGSIDIDVKSSCVEKLVDSVFMFTCDATTQKKASREDDEMTDDCFVLTSAVSLLAKIERELDENESLRLVLNRSRLNRLVAVIIRHQRIVEGALSGLQRNPDRRTKLRLIGSCQVLRAACCEFGLVLSTKLCTRLDKRILRSALISDMDQGVLRELCRSFLWLWDRSNLANDRLKKLILPTRQGKELRLPIAVALTALCGTAAFTMNAVHTTAQPERHIQLMDLVDSDASAAECVAEDEHLYEEMIRVIFQSVQCIRLVTESIPDDEFFSSFSYGDGNSVKDQKPLPFVLERVATFFADTILLAPSGLDSETDENPLWGNYSRGTRSLGSNVDSILHRAYKGLYGFTLSNSNDGLPTVAGWAGQEIKPENITTAAQLYRCVMRCRKAPPKAALLTIMAAMPRVGETTQSKALEKFLYSSSSRFSHTDVRMLVKQPSNCEAKFSEISRFLEMSNSSSTRNSSNEEAEILRRGIAEVYIEASMPPLDDTPEKDSRTQCAQMEKDLWSRFEIILHNLTHYTCADCEGWFRLAQLCLFKANVIADRLGLSKGFSRSNDFMPPGRATTTRQPRKELSKLVDNQEKEFHLRSIGRTESLGSNLKLYMQHSWASFESLKLLHEKIGEDLKSVLDEEDDTSELQIWNEIATLYADGKFSVWEQAWGGIFVCSLRTMATKCMCLTLYLLQKGLGLSDADRRNALIVETCEGLGTGAYSEQLGSQWYGYPMQIMPHIVKRDVAQTALVCYSHAVKVNSNKEDAKADNESWDLFFMMGKCHEKIAGTYGDEAFSYPDSMRVYETSMRSALESYSKSLLQAQACEKDGSLLVEQQGGSSHGAMEAVYRLHATRLKCLIDAVQHGDDEREQAESEALRLTEPFSFSGNTDKASEHGSVRDRVWGVAVDVANAMVHCRTKHSFFHRSIYRHSQCLMWAPVLSDPGHLWQEGSSGEVPALKALKMRGLNSESAVESAAGVIRAIFDKKRAQLCAVWVTSGAESPFQGINCHVRKFDSLRGKYISAFITCLQLCNKRDELENFLRWANSSRRDLPSHFGDTAGSNPPTGHTSDTLLVKARSLSSNFFLTSVKRETNAALASVILHESKATKVLESHLKLSYSCLLRLNADLSSLQKRRARRSRGVKQVVDALIAIYSAFSDSAPAAETFDWSTDGQVCLQLEAAVKRCRELFPSVSASFLSKRPTQRKKKDADSNQCEKIVGKKRKEVDGTFAVVKQFNVEVPEGLSSGETFITEIKEGNSVKRIRLTVPDGATRPTTLKFNLRVQGSPEPSNDADSP